ncbi:MAG: hypothetical protein CXZ00_13050 [Acidobacteria bacterium]|nr:MAG: hypothetical protein CXZ00_13050 [Acidobacteriota bacterium]
MANNDSELEKRLWDAADNLRANSKRKPSQYSVPVFGLIFLRYADHMFALTEKELLQVGSGRRWAPSDGSYSWFWQLSKEGCTVERRRN